MCYLCGLDSHDELSFEDVYGNIPNLPSGIKEAETPSILEKERKEAGKCPQCGELGYFSRFQYTCTKHGPY